MSYQLMMWIAAIFLHSVIAVNPTVPLSYASYQGTALKNGVTQWLGIRYAAPPIGELRFAAPQDPLHETAVQRANKHGKICLSTGAAPSTNTTSEDCLFLDVYAPSNAAEDSALPVFFFIQGGGFNTNSNPNYNGSGLVLASQKDIVVVNFNYRVGPYGFLTGQEVVRGKNGSLNNGLKDQRKALEWVQKYITCFGGDPKKVTMAGDSAGAASVTLQLTAYGGKDTGLFQATAAESQSFATVLTVDESQYQYDNLAIRTGCFQSNNTFECLRGLNASAIQAVNFNTPYPGAQIAPLYMYGPVIDNDLIQDLTLRAFEEGKFIRVPGIYGDDTNEGTAFVPKTTANISASSTFLQAQFPYLSLAQLRKIASLYPIAEQFPNSGAYWRQASNAYGELRYICPGIYLSSLYSKYGVSNIYNYHWDVVDDAQAAEGLGVPHTVEVHAIWGPENTSGAPASYSTYNRAVVPVVQGYWTSFVRTVGNPNSYRAKGTPEWKRWTAAGYNRILFRTNSTRMETVPLDQRARCEYLSSIGVDIRQ